MSDAGMSCQKCGKPNDVAWGICADCKGAKDQLVASSANKHHGTAVAIWQVESTDASKVENQSLPYFKSNSVQIAQLICDDSEKRIDSNQVTGFGGQTTVQDFGGTATLDFQGVRKGGNTYWLDYQGQLGGGGSKRKTYFQVMIQCGTGLPEPDTINRAILASLGKAKRSVVYKNTTDRPK